MSPIFIDFEASSLSITSWPIEVGIAKADDGQVVVESKLIRPVRGWSEDDWSPESEAVHGIPRSALDDAEPAADVAKWLLKKLNGQVVVSDAPEFDQMWLDRLLQTAGGQHDIEIAEFGDVV